MNPFDQKYGSDEFYWGLNPSRLCYQILELMPPIRNYRLLDVGCGEGRNAVFFARNGFDVTAFDLSEVGVNKTADYAARVGTQLNVFQSDINQYKIESPFHIIFSSGVLQYVPSGFRKQIIQDYQDNTEPDGLNAFNVFIKKSFIPAAPDTESNAYFWYSGEILSYYWDWKIEYFSEEIFDCHSSGVPHQHAVNRIIARKIQHSDQ